MALFDYDCLWLAGKLKITSLRFRFRLVLFIDIPSKTIIFLSTWRPWGSFAAIEKFQKLKGKGVLHFVRAISRAREITSVAQLKKFVVGIVGYTCCSLSRQFNDWFMAYTHSRFEFPAAIAFILLLTLQFFFHTLITRVKMMRRRF